MASAFAVVLAHPSLWLLGALGFAARGGIIVLAAVVVVLPTPVEVRMLLGDNLSSSGFSAGFMRSLVPIAVGIGLLVAAALVVAARAELAAFERFVGDPDAPAGFERGGERAGAVDRRAVVGRLFVIQLAALVGLAAAAVPFVLTVQVATLDELLRPTPGGASLYLRVISAARDPLVLFLGALLVIDMLAAFASRQVMSRHLRPGVTLASPLCRPLGALATSTLTWLTAAAVVVPAIWALDVGWDATRAAYLGERATVDLASLVWLAAVAVAFAALWAAAVLLAGFASAVRAALWSAESLR